MNRETNLDDLFGQLLNRQTFPWQGNSQTVSEIITQNALVQARNTFNDLKAETNITSPMIIQKLTGRAQSWNYEGYLADYSNTTNDGILEFSEVLNQKLTSLSIDVPEGEKWVLQNLAFETKKAVRQLKTAESEMQRVKEETAKSKVKKLQTTPTNDGYGDQFNKSVCQMADKENLSLPQADQLIRKTLLDTVTDEEIEDYLALTNKERSQKQLKNQLAGYLKKFENPKTALDMTVLRFEIDQIKTDKIWGVENFDRIVLAGLRGESINLITMLCLINQFDFNGGYVSNPNLFAYKENSKLEAIPLIVDEMLQVPDLFSYYGIQTNLSIFVADTDYSEIGEYGPVNDDNLKNISLYLQNLQSYVGNRENVQVKLISQVTDNNPLYERVKSNVLSEVTGFRDPDFTREWYQKFEDDVERRFDSQCKRRLYPPNQLRSQTLKLTRNIWACNSAQGAVFGTLGKNTIFLSTERRDRDQNYIIDKSSRASFPLVLYILKAAENWNRKLVQKTDS